jgi:hypothetical protein
MENLYDYLTALSNDSDFKAELSRRGGYLTFSNSGRRGSAKYFHIGLDSIIQTLTDIYDHLDVFSKMTEYDETKWRTEGAELFQDPVANATSCVQTKPLFSTLSKLIMWGNEPNLSTNDPDQKIVINAQALENTIEKLNNIADSFTPLVHHRTKSLDKPLQIIYYGAPGTGKSFTVDDNTDPDRTTRTTFHPDTDYASFVGAYKPTMGRVPIVAFDGTRVTTAKGVDGHDGKEEKIVYRFVPQSFLKAYVAAWSDLSHPYYLVIEEINRGNCAQIFGDLFQLLDRNSMGCSSYAIDTDSDIEQFLTTDEKGFAKLSETSKEEIRTFILKKDNGKENNIGEEILSGKKLLLPPNLYIWATMNTSDQSLFPVDSAFKRRWDWHYVPINDAHKGWYIQVNGKRYDWWTFLNKINERIYDVTKTEDKKLGYFFCKATPRGAVTADTFVGKVIFYLWNDVFKDFGLEESNLFKNAAGEEITFTQYYDTDAAGKTIVRQDLVEQFLNNLGLTPMEDAAPQEKVDNEAGEDDSNGGGKDYSKYRVNGGESGGKRPTAIAVLNKYVADHPALSVEDVLKAWRPVTDVIPLLLRTEEERQNEIATSTDAGIEKRREPIRWGDGCVLYLYMQWRPDNFGKFIDAVNAQPWGIRITQA